MPTTGLESARLKLKRAHHHVASAEAEVNAFEQSDPWRIKTEWLPGEETDTELVYALTVTKWDDEPLSGLPAIIGDCLTNLRAALDHAVFDHSCATLAANKRRDLTPEEQRALFFPLARSNKTLRKSRSSFAPEVYAYVHSLHDFDRDWRSTDPIARSLALLREFVNYDKHRAVIPGMADVHVSAKSAPDEIELIAARVEHASGPVVLGKPFMRLPFRKVKSLEGVDRETLLRDFVVNFPLVLRVPNLETGGNVNVGTPSEIPRQPPLMTTLRGMYEAVNSVLDQLQKLGL